MWDISPIKQAARLASYKLQPLRNSLPRLRASKLQ
jgi:hypothetical protein